MLRSSLKSLIVKTLGASLPTISCVFGLHPVVNNSLSYVIDSPETVVTVLALLSRDTTPQFSLKVIPYLS